MDILPMLNPSDIDFCFKHAEFRGCIDKFMQADGISELPDMVEAVLNRKFSGEHEDADDDFLHELETQKMQNQLSPEVRAPDHEIESDFEDLYETDEELDNLYNARQYVEKKMVSDEFFNMDDKKWDEMIREATEKGYLRSTKDCEGILEDMLNWNKLLPGM